MAVQGFQKQRGSSLLNFLVKRSEISRDPFEFEWEGSSLIFFQTTESVEAILLSQQNQFIRSGGPPRLATLLGNGLLRSQGETHQKQRRITSHAFAQKFMEGYSKEVRALAGSHAVSWSRKSKFDLHQNLIRLTLDMVGRIFFSLDAEEVKRLGWALQTCIENLEPGRTRLREAKRAILFRAAIHRLDGLLYSYIDTKGTQDNLVGVLSRARDGKGDIQGMTRAGLRDELVTLLVAGHETTATALSWCGYLIARDPSLLIKIGERGPDFAKAVFAESLRLYSPAWVLLRRALEDVEVTGVKIKKGQIAVISPYTMGRDKGIFEQAEVCRPERWLEGAGYLRPGFYPFGIGKRRCLGESFAWMQGTEVLSVWSRTLSLSLPNLEEVLPAALFTLRPSGGLWVRVK